ncbi:MAG: hypothetical protein PHR51_02125 [Patescibacteria group bacterium]|nr:hypothetical protein [Patescibacteria group bacterium]
MSEKPSGVANNFWMLAMMILITLYAVCLWQCYWDVMDLYERNARLEANLDQALTVQAAMLERIKTLEAAAPKALTASELGQVSFRMATDEPTLKEEIERVTGWVLP